MKVKRRRKCEKPYKINYTEPISIPLVGGFIEEPNIPNCCKGCLNWKGPFTVCNCTLPTLEMQRGWSGKIEY